MVKWNAQDYHRHSAAQQEWARELIAKLGLIGTERLLDVGCGDGKITAQIAGMLPSGAAVGVDKSEEMIGFAAQTFTADAWPNLSFAVMDASALTFDAEFDIVFSNAALHWIIDHRAVLRGIARLFHQVDAACCKWPAKAMPLRLSMWFPAQALSATVGDTVSPT